MEQIFESPLTVQKDMLKEFGWGESIHMAYEYFNDNYFAPRPGGGKEDIALQYKKLLPGRMYTFQYDPKYKDVLSFYDNRPVILVIKSYIHENTGNNLQLGVNLNFIPKEIRVFLLEKLWQAYSKMIEADIKKRSKPDDSGELRTDGRQTLLFTKNYDFEKLLDYLWDTLSKSNWKFALRQYIWSRISNGKFIDFDDWGLSTLIDTKDTMGMSIGQIHKLYWSAKSTKEIKKRRAKK